MLILFDIDATLLSTQRAGVLAMGDAGRELFGPEFDEQVIDYAGRLDPLIIADLLRAHARPVGAREIEIFRHGYRKHLFDRLKSPGVARALPGVPELLDAVEHVEGVTIGLLTGNYADTGAGKLAAAGIDLGRFAVRVWGDESPIDPPAREHLPGVALDRHAAMAGSRLPGERVLIIGDTIHDVACARAHGCRSLGVATGKYTRDELLAVGADRAEADLTDTRGLLEWITTPMRSTPTPT